MKFTENLSWMLDAIKGNKLTNLLRKKLGKKPLPMMSFRTSNQGPLVRSKSKTFKRNKRAMAVKVSAAKNIQRISVKQKRGDIKNAIRKANQTAFSKL